MATGRNAPCPCGSGRKYKHCCLERDHRASSGQMASPEVRDAAAAEVWEADLLPLPGVTGSRPGAAAVVSVVMAGGVLLRTDASDHPGSEPAEVAQALAAEVRAAAEAIGSTPERLHVGDTEVATFLAPILRPDGVAAVAGGPLPQVAEAGRSLFEHVHGEDLGSPGGVRETWRAWGRSAAEIAALFRAAATFHRAAPWRLIGNEQPIAAWMPGGRKWAAVVMGEGEEEFGLALYSEVDDFLALLTHEPREVWGVQEGRIYGILFEQRGRLPRAMQKEVAVAGWEVADASAYPVLMSLRSPAGGVCARDWADIVVLLDAVPRFLTEGLNVRAAGLAVEDPVSGAGFMLLPDLSAPLAPLPNAGCAEGPGADPEAVLTADQDALVNENRELSMDFCDWLEEAGLAPTTIEKHLANVGLLFWYLEAEGVPVRAVHEYDLRCFLFDWVHRKGAMSKSRIAGVPASLRKFFKFLAKSRGVCLPWAREVLGDRQLYLARARGCPREPFWTQRIREWLGELTLDLHERSLLPDDTLGEDEEWGGTMGPVEWELHTELRRRWLLWRDEIIRSGVEDHAELLNELHRRQQAWEAEPNPKVGRRTPVEAVLAERAEVERVVGRRG